MRDEELRAELASWVHEVAERPTPGLALLRRRARSRLLRRIGSACAIVVVIVGIGLSVNAGLQGGGTPAGHPRHSGGPAASGAPVRFTWYPHAWFPAQKPLAADAGPSAAPYLVEVVNSSTTYVASLASGAQTTQIVAPPGSTYFGVAAAGDGHTFLLAANAGQTVQFYEVRVGPGGKAGQPVRVLSVPESSVVKGSQRSFTFTISPDASMLAYTTLTGLKVVSLATGQATSWQLPGGRGSVNLVSWAEDDRILGISWEENSDPAQSGMRLLDTRATGSLLQASKMAIPQSILGANWGSPLMTPDGSKILVSIFSDFASQYEAQDAIVEEYSASTGRPLTAVTPKVHVDLSANSPDSLDCQPVWTDSSGSQVASFCASSGSVSDAGVFLDDHGHITSTSLEVPVVSENVFSDGMPPILSSTFAW